ncbi:PaaI family thioesterase [Paracoccus sp. PS-1]|uniref:PaaI family thioesterase n=1 Tax=unclassified Paracoccus (in: a-proteobacteria) TaxID=2688777 RepID=UPI00048DC073|nr:MULTISPECIES: PaaI family thioesterase [unclassified Paracoccus (in: a-proteobacteria)]MDQ7263889.1 PaaI family thioesterase [Paracoccus sp. PS1]
MALVMGREALNEFLGRAFPQVAGQVRVESLDEARLTARLAVDDQHLRPGGTVSGPAMFALADVTIYLAILARIGEVALAVTTNASIDFMRKPAAGRDLLADCRILKLGRALAVGEVLIRSAGAEEPVARCSMTYSIPPKR